MHLPLHLVQLMPALLQSPGHAPPLAGNAMNTKTATISSCSARRLFAFWTGDNALTENRLEAFRTFSKTGLKPVLVTANELDRWVVPSHPLHPAYEHLSPVHRADYLRSYFMHHHGGGYSDVKPQTGSWLPVVEKVLKSSRLYGAGYREIKGGTALLQNNVVLGRTFVLPRKVHPIAAKAITYAMRGLYPAIIGNGSFYFRPGTSFTRRWLAETERRLDILLPMLKKHTWAHPRDRAGGVPGLPHEGYPVPWSFILGDILGPMSLLYSLRLSRALPPPVFSPACYL